MNQTILKASILKYLASENAWHLSDMAERLGYLRPSLSRAMQQLRRDGYVVYSQKKWSLTEHGRKSLLTHEQVYGEQIAPLVKKIKDIAECHGIPFVASFEVEGWLVTSQRLDDACSEIRCAYGELTGEWPI